MAATTGKQLPVGLRKAVLYALNASGTPNGTSHLTPYEGISWEGPKAFAISGPQARSVPHYGGDRVLNTDALPPTDAMTAELRVADYRYDIHSALTGITVTTTGEAKEIAHYTSKQGNEPQVGLMLYQQSLDLTSGARRWRSIVIPKCRCIPVAAGFGETTEDVVYQVFPQVVTARLWGDALVLADDGYTDAPMFEYMSEYQPWIASFLGNGAATEFNFSASHQAAATGKIATFVNGAPGVGVTPAADGVTFNPAPAADARIDVWYEYA